MKTKLCYLAALAAVGSICWLGYFIGYRRGQEKPRCVWTTNGNTVTAFGWDSGNDCIAAWSWDTGTNGRMSWERLK